MNENIAKLSEIEEAAEAIVKNAEATKTTLEKEMQESRDAFDTKLSEETEKKINTIRDDLNEKMTKLLESQSSDNNIAIQQLKEDFEKNHSEYAKSIFERIIEV